MRSELRGHLVIDGMAGLDVVVAHRDGVVFHIGDERHEGVFAGGIDVVVVVRRVVTLQAVAGVEEEDVLRSDGVAQAVHPGVDGHQAGLVGLAFDIGFVEPVAVDVTGGDDMQGVRLRRAGKGQQKQGKN